MKKILLPYVFVLLSRFTASSQITFYEPFDDIASIISEEPYDWYNVNASDPVGNNSWYQADLTMGVSAVLGEAQSYVQVDRSSTSASTGGTISNWLISPVSPLSNGDSIHFYAVSFNNINRPDRLEIRISTLGENSVMPSSPTDLGSFTHLVAIINPNLTSTGFPSVQNGDSWQQYRYAVNGINPGMCRVALRYHVTNAGSAGPNASTIAVDEFYLLGPGGYTGIENPGTKPNLNIYPNPAENYIGIAMEDRDILNMEILDMNGRIVLATRASSLSRKLDISELATGMYLLRITTESGLVIHERFVKK